MSFAFFFELMNHNGTLKSAELRFRQMLEDYFISVYDEKSLPSHGIYHHRRVWNYIKEILLLNVFVNNSSDYLPEKLIIAAYLHDIGMSVEKGQRHGRISRNFCEEFFRINNLNSDSFIDVLEAIEHHDVKDYPENNKVSELLSILSIADDLDAFGYTGIYRYTEIYFMRGMRPADIGVRIKENARKRFDNFEMAVIPDYVEKHRKRYEILDNFMTGCIRQSENYRFGREEHHGYCGAIELLIQLISNKKDIIEFSGTALKYPDDPVISSFFAGLENERKAILII